MKTKAFYSSLAIGICNCTDLQLNMNQTIAEQDDRSHQTSSPTIIGVMGKGCIVVFSSGNNGGTATQPAASAPSSTLVVGAIKQNGIKADFSSYGSYVDVVAPGVDIWTTTDNGYYTLVNGTSYAAPHICGIAALIWATNPSLPAWRVCDILEQSTKRVGMNEYQVDNIVRLNGPWNQFYGYGLVDAYKAISSAWAQEPSDPVIHTDLNEVDNAFLLSLGIDRDDQEWNSIYLAPSYGDAIISIANYDPSATYVWTSTLPPYSGYGALLLWIVLLKKKIPEHSMKFNVQS